jgi:hypothetical protein
MRVVPVGGQVDESLDPLDRLAVIPDAEVVVEPLRPVLERTVPPLDVVADVERQRYPLDLKPFERRCVPRSVVHDEDRLPPPLHRSSA